MGSNNLIIFAVRFDGPTFISLSTVIAIPFEFFVVPYRLLNLQFVSNKSSSCLEIELEKEEKHKVNDAVTVDKKRNNNNDIQRSEEENNQQQLQSTTNTVF